MSASNTRIKDYETVHHLVSRIAHRVYFLGEEERNEFLGIIRRAAEFAGLKLLAWCIMSNHFHLLVYLPQPIELDEEELMRRYQVLKGAVARANAEQQLAKWRELGDDQQAEDWLNALRRRMYDIGEFMKTIKQWFTEEYNRRQKHVGTLWESVYHDHIVPVSPKDMSRVAGYIHLNPIRAAITADFCGYAWSSFHALSCQDRAALDGMRFVYGDESASANDLMERHIVLMNVLLEGIKRQRAEEISRKRAAGYELPSDHLTTESMVAQAAAHLNEVQNALVEFHAEREIVGRAKGRARKVSEEMFLAALKSNPMASVEALSELLSIAPSSVYGRLRTLQNRGRISRMNRSSPWIIA